MKEEFLAEGPVLEGAVLATITPTLPEEFAHRRREGNMILNN